MLGTTLVREWMTTPVITVTPFTSISNAHQIMKEKGIRRLPVLDNDDLVGIVTLGDVREASPSDATTLSIWELNYLWSQLTVEKIMSRKLFTVGPDETVLAAAQLMLDQKISGLPVVEKSGKLVGMITESDIFRMLVRMGTTEAQPVP
ncbi:MAG: CBS domain-containing protein [Anaerolineae bacterium]|jgi:acetoin utilization protein AcuB|nr:CBS domain-containing protein [Anaerolineae bacterium]